MRTAVRRWLRDLFPPAPPARRSPRLGVHALEDRLAPAAWTVNVPEADPFALLRYVEVVQTGALFQVKVNDTVVASRFSIPIFAEVTEVRLNGSARQEIFVARAGGVNLLCANAGVLARVGPLAEHSVADWEYTLSVNVLGIVKTVAAFLPALRGSAPDAHIVTTASLGGLTADVRAPIGAYIASKYACVGYSEMLRAELASEGIGVSVLCPGMVTSNLLGTSAENRPGVFGAQAAPRLAPTNDAEGGGAPPSDWFMPAEQVGPIVVRAIRANRLHVLTHPGAKPLVERRLRGVLDDFDFATSETER